MNQSFEMHVETRNFLFSMSWGNCLSFCYHGWKDSHKHSWCLGLGFQLSVWFFLNAVISIRYGMMYYSPKSEREEGTQRRLMGKVKNAQWPARVYREQVIQPGPSYVIYKWQWYSARGSQNPLKIQHELGKNLGFLTFNVYGLGDNSKDAWTLVFCPVIWGYYYLPQRLKEVLN